MLERIGGKTLPETAEISIGQASFPAPFETGLEYNMPARGHWNIVHSAMLVPGLHQIYACARGCLRGVILTAGEMTAMDRMSFVTLEEEDFYSGRMEDSVIQGATHILEQLEKKGVLPPAVMVVLSCVQLFAGVDFPYILESLRQRFPKTDFIDGYMHPTMRKSGLTPDQVMRRQIYAPLKACPRNGKSVTLIGSDHAFPPTADHVAFLKKNGFAVRELASCGSYAEYLRLAESFLFVTNIPPARHAGESLAKRLGRKELYLPVSYSFSEIRHSLLLLAEALEVPPPSPEEFAEKEERTEKALQQAKERIGDAAITIDHTATFRPLSMARLLLEHNFRVTKIHADAFAGEEKEDFLFLKEHHPALLLSSPTHPAMRFAGKGGSEIRGRTLAIGQGAAYFAGTPFFVNGIADSSLFGFDGIFRLAEEMKKAWETPSLTEQTIQIKGLGCRSCLI